MHEFDEKLPMICIGGLHQSHGTSTSPLYAHIGYCLVVTAQPGMTPEMTWPPATAMLEPDAQ